MPKKSSEDPNNASKQEVTATEKPLMTSNSTGVLSGAGNLYDGHTHFGVAVEVAASGKVSQVMIPDVSGISQGKPIYITAPVTLKGENLGKFLNNKGVHLPESISGLIANTTISCDALYFSTQKEKLTDDTAKEYNENIKDTAKQKKAGDEVESGPLLMKFELKVDGGLIGTLSGDEALGSLFDINAISLRVLRCPAGKKEILENYVQELSQD